MKREFSNPRELFSAVLDLETEEEREALLKEIADQSPELAQAVRELLQAHVQAQEFDFFPTDPSKSHRDHGENAGTLPMEDEIESSEGAEGSMIGRYKLLQRIGEGGMGEVWMAEQREPVERKVALKIIKAGMDTKSVVARFEAERQALALMDHPHIARVLDGGATERGRPYFVMELVQGIPITGYCDQARLKTRDRLKLFLQVCEAVQHAHQKGIIHRDIKPNNIIVANHDGKPYCKVIDFGIAKATSQRLTEKTLFTRHGQMIGTPAYMSPEQAQFSIEDVDTRADIYSLGCLLYELLTGSPPLESSELRSMAFDEMCRTIREKDPPKPSARLSTLGEKLATVASQRNTDAKRLGRIITGELDWIVMRSLEKDRNRRYHTAAAFGEDVQRHLDDEPVEASPPSVSYRTQKFIRRHLGTIAAATAFVMVLIAGLGVSILQTKEAMEARQAESKERTRAEDNATEARINAQMAQRASDASEDSLYRAHMLVAGRDREDGRIGKVRDLLERHLPQVGEGRSERRAWEWFYLRSLLSMHERSLALGDRAVVEVRWSPDGTHCALGTETGQILVVDARSWQLSHTLNGHSNRITGLAWQKTGRGLASSAEDGTILLWKMQPGAVPVRVFSGTQPIEDMAWSPDGSMIAICGPEGLLSLRDAQSGEVIRSWTSKERILCLAWSPSGKHLATGHDGSHSLVRLWHPADGVRCKSTSVTAAGLVTALTWSPDEHSLAWGTMHGQAVIWEPESETKKTVIKTSNSLTIRDVAWGPKSNFLVAAGDSQSIDLIDVKAEAVVTRWHGHRGPVNALAWHPSGHKILSGGEDGTAKIWDATRRSTALSMTKFSNWLSCVRWSPDGSRIATAYFSGEFKIWNAEMTKALHTIRGHKSKIWGLAWSPDGTRLATLDAKGVLKGWDAGRGGELWSSVAPAMSDSQVSWDPTGNLVATPALGAVILWDGHSGERLRSIGKDVKRMAWNSDWTQLATTGDTSPLLQIWTREGVLVKAIPLQHEGGNCQGWSPDDQFVAIGSEKGRLQIVAADEGRVVLDAQILSGWLKLAWSPDGKRLAAGGQDGTVRIIDPDTAEEVMFLRDHTAELFTLDWSPDGKRLATGSFDETMRIWGVPPVILPEVDLSDLAESGSLNTTISAPAVAKRDMMWAALPERSETLPAGAIDLSRHYTMPLDHYPYTPITESVSGDVPFDSRAAVQLNNGKHSDWIRHHPRAIRGIEINRRCESFHFLHSAHYGDREPVGTVIGQYLIHYNNGGQESVPIVLGKDVWNHHQRPEALAALQQDHSNLFRAGSINKDTEFVLSRTTWDNPHPERLIASIDFVIGETRAAPFLVALTVQ